MSRQYRGGDPDLGLSPTEIILCDWCGCELGSDDHPDSDEYGDVCDSCMKDIGD